MINYGYSKEAGDFYIVKIRSICEIQQPAE